jgi:hypothetical protein
VFWNSRQNFPGFFSWDIAEARPGMAYGSAAGASAAAAAARRRMQEEEEEMTDYSDRDLAGEWEFKIVRANTGVFRNPVELEKLVKEEAPAGWVLLEKFDNSRVRFKRPVSARRNDSRLPQGVDPYRTHYGMHPALFASLLALAIIGVSFGFVIILMLIIGGVIGLGAAAGGAF